MNHGISFPAPPPYRTASSNGNAKKFRADVLPQLQKQAPTEINAPHASRIPSPKLKDEKGNPEYDPAQLVALLHPSWQVQNLTTHAAHAERIRDLIGGDLCYSPNLGWLVYSNQFWQLDDKNATKASARIAKLTQAVRDEVAMLYSFAGTLAQAGRESDAKAMSKAAIALLRHTKQAESKAFIEGALHLAAGLLAVETEQFDQKPWLIGFQNGTWDKGVWREHRREDYLLHLLPVHLDFEADRREWLATLDRITGGDCDFAQMAQDVAGYILSGASHLRLLPFFYGPKGTGKSTFAELLQTVLGHMAATIDPKKLQDNAARERLGADLWNRRLAVCSEAGSQRLEAELLKTLSGGDQLAVRFLFREAFTAPPRHVLLMVTNDPPKMDAHDAALKDRVIALPFVHPLDNGAPLELTGGKRIEAVRQDPQSPLVRGFAAWAMEGLARVWQSQEIHRAACVATATAQFWADTDQLTPFWESIEESELLEGIGKTELRERYEAWCKAEGARPKAAREWTRACKDGRGLEEGRTSDAKKRIWFLTKQTKQGAFSNCTQGTL
jgi:putative DNA primase/helicase